MPGGRQGNRLAHRLLIRHIEWNKKMSASRADFLPTDSERRALQEMGLSDVPFPRYDRE